MATGGRNGCLIGIRPCQTHTAFGLQLWTPAGAEDDLWPDLWPEDDLCACLRVYADVHKMTVDLGMRIHTHTHKCTLTGQWHVGCSDWVKAVFFFLTDLVCFLLFDVACFVFCTGWGLVTQVTVNCAEPCPMKLWAVFYCSKLTWSVYFRCIHTQVVIEYLIYQFILFFFCFFLA